MRLSGCHSGRARPSGGACAAVLRGRRTPWWSRSREDLPDELPSTRVGVVVQTTQSQERLADLVAHLAPRTKELLVYNTICSATEQRQTRRDSHGRRCGCGDRGGGQGLRQHADARRALRRGAEPHSPRRVGRGDRPAWFDGVQTVGITAGASTPPEQIEAVPNE